MKIKKGDKVRVISGKDKGKTGAVLYAFPKKDKVVVEGVAMQKHHEKPRQQGKKGSVIERPGPIHVSNLARI